MSLNFVFGKLTDDLSCIVGFRLFGVSVCNKSELFSVSMKMIGICYNPSSCNSVSSFMSCF